MSSVVCGRLVAINETILQVEIDPEQELGMTEGQTVAVALMADQARKPPVAYKRQAKQLWLSGFFRTPAVWKAVGSDIKYQGWCRQQPSAHSDQSGSANDPIEYAHVRRVNKGAGVARKPPYSGIPLLQSEHQRQHQHGETSLRPKEWFEEKAIQYVHLWCWETVKAALKYDTWVLVPPRVLFEWAVKKGVEQYLPPAYRFEVPAE